MRIPTGQFVLFQFTGEHAGRVMFRPGPTKAARHHFLECVKDLEALVVARVLVKKACFMDVRGTPKVECLRYRGQKEIATWGLIPDLTDLCQTFGDWIAGAGKAEKEAARG